MGQVLTLCGLHQSVGHNFSIQSFSAHLQLSSTLPEDQLSGRGGLSSQSIEHLAGERQMLTAGLTASICPLSLFQLWSDNRTEGTGVLCVKKVDLIACDPPFSRRAWRAIRLSLILAWRVITAGWDPQNPQMFILIHDTQECLFIQCDASSTNSTVQKSRFTVVYVVFLYHNNITSNWFNLFASFLIYTL